MSPPEKAGTAQNHAELAELAVLAYLRPPSPTSPYCTYLPHSYLKPTTLHLIGPPPPHISLIFPILIVQFFLRYSGLSPPLPRPYSRHTHSPYTILSKWLPSLFNQHKWTSWSWKLSVRPRRPLISFSLRSTLLPPKKKHRGGR